MDSGSDVVTATESLIADLQLEYIRNVDSRGPYSAADKPLYKGVLKLGTEEFQVEVSDKTVKELHILFGVSTVNPNHDNPIKKTRILEQNDGLFIQIVYFYTRTHSNENCMYS